MRSVWALQDAKNMFSAVVNRACEVEPQIVTRRGVPVAVLVSYESYRESAAAGASCVDVLLGGPRYAGGFTVERQRGTMRKTELV